MFKKVLLASALCLPLFVNAQTEKPKPNWHNLHLKTDGVFGISTEKAYAELLKNKKHTPVLVAVIDGGVDINHEDLKAVIWNNAGEVAGNKADDDKNGFTDDAHGWSFIGSPAKGNIQYDNTELVRLIKRQQPLFENVDPANVKPADEAAYKKYQAMKMELGTELEKYDKNAKFLGRFRDVLKGMVTRMQIQKPTLEDFKNYKPSNDAEDYVRKTVVKIMADEDFETLMKDDIEGPYKRASEQVNYHLNLNYDPRDTVGDDYLNSSQHFYGNPDITGPHNEHGTHVAGIIGAMRDNSLGINGIANDVQIMVVQTVPVGDERDKDVANAIRYAAENGAKVINMSFGKTYAFDKKAVDEAVKFAVSKDVLIVHAAGNDNVNTDVATRYPNRNYADGSGTAASWIEVGASGLKDDEGLKAPFSCYGKTAVDVFAPGVRINSCQAGGGYIEYDGTSMASPVVAGLAALIRSYYPKLTALQVKEIILKSVVPVTHKVKMKDKAKDKEVSVPFTDLCKTGGIVNAYNALKLAETY